MIAAILLSIALYLSAVVVMREARAAMHRVFIDQTPLAIAACIAWGALYFFS